MQPNRADTDPPRERMISLGPTALSDVELLALLLGSGSRGEPVLRLAARLLDEVGGLRSLAQTHPAEVLCLRGLGVAKATRLIAAVELGGRALRRRWRLGEPFTSSRQVYAHYQPLVRNEKRESFFSAMLDARNRLIGEQEISRGSLVASIVHPREVFRPAIRAAAASIICVHNHPSGDPACSGEDLAVTRRLHEAGLTIGIELVDHIIIGECSYTSFRDQGISPFGIPLHRRPRKVEAMEELGSH